MRILYHATDPDRWLLRALSEMGHDVHVIAHPNQSVVLRGMGPVGAELFDDPAGVTLRPGSDVTPRPSPTRLPPYPSRVDSLLPARAELVIPRPLSLSQLVDALERIERHRQGTVPGASLSTRQRCMTFRRVFVELTPQEFQVMECLLYDGGPVSRDRLCRYLWHDSHSANPRNISPLLHRLRGKLMTRLGIPLIVYRRPDGYTLAATFSSPPLA